MRAIVAVSSCLLTSLAAARGEAVVRETFDGPLDATVWRFDESAQVGDGALTLPAGKHIQTRGVTTHGAVAITFACKLFESGHDPYLAVHFGPPERPDQFLATLRPSHGAGFLFFNDRKADKEIFRALGYLDPIGRGSNITLRLYPEGRRITYDCDGAFYGERILADDEMPDLGELTGFTFYANPGASQWSAITIERIDDTPASLYGAQLNDKPPLPAYPKGQQIARTLTFLDPTPLSPADRFMATCLQGVVNRDVARVYLGYHHYVQIDTAEDWRGVLERRGHTFDPVDLSGLIKRYARECKGVILYDANAWNSREHPVESHQINIATTAAGVLGALPVTPEQKARFFPRANVVLDLRNRWSNAREAYRWAWDTFWDKCNHGAIAHLENAYYCTPVRDYVVAQKLFAFLSSDVRDESDYRFYLDMLAATPVNTPILGMTALLYGPRNPQAVFDEDGLFRVAAELGKYFVYAFSSGSLSVHSAIDADIVTPPPAPPAPKLDRDKVYLAFMVSEGENLSWGMDLRAKGFRDTQFRPLVAKAWSLSGAMVDLCPAVLDHYYRNAAPADGFFMDGAGLGDHYNLNLYGIRLKPHLRETVRDEFLELTRIYMNRMGLTIVRPFDPTTSIPRHSLERYVEALPNLTALFTGYNAERGLQPDAPRNFTIGGVPVFRTSASSAGSVSDEHNAGVLVKNIRNAAGKQRPAFINVFVLGNYVIDSSRCLSMTMEQLGPEFVAVRPEHFAELYNRHLKADDN